MVNLVDSSVGKTAAIKPRLGRRARAVAHRQQLEAMLDQGYVLDLDFEGVEATQSYIDELIGLLVLHRGPQVMQRIRFHKCSADLKAIIKFVVADRAAQYLAHASRPVIDPAGFTRN